MKAYKCDRCGKFVELPSENHPYRRLSICRGLRNDFTKDVCDECAKWFEEQFDEVTDERNTKTP